MMRAGAWLSAKIQMLASERPSLDVREDVTGGGALLNVASRCRSHGQTPIQFALPLLTCLRPKPPQRLPSPPNLPCVGGC